MDENKLAIFEGKQIRKIIFQNEWWFSVVDIIAVLTDSLKPRVYWNAMKTRVKAQDGFELSTFCRQLKLESADGKKYFTDCANTQSIFRIIQSVPSPKVEPLKMWLAKVGYERIQEIENPELAQDRMKKLYEQKRTRSHYHLSYQLSQNSREPEKNMKVLLYAFSPFGNNHNNISEQVLLSIPDRPNLTKPMKYFK